MIGLTEAYDAIERGAGSDYIESLPGEILEDVALQAARIDDDEVLDAILASDVDVDIGDIYDVAEQYGSGRILRLITAPRCHTIARGAMVRK